MGSRRKGEMQTHVSRRRLSEQNRVRVGHRFPFALHPSLQRCSKATTGLVRVKRTQLHLG